MCLPKNSACTYSLLWQVSCCIFGAALSAMSAFSGTDEVRLLPRACRVSASVVFVGIPRTDERSILKPSAIAVTIVGSITVLEIKPYVFARVCARVCSPFLAL